MTEKPEVAPDTIYARIEALEKRVAALEKGAQPCKFELRMRPNLENYGTPRGIEPVWAYCTVHHSYFCTGS